MLARAQACQTVALLTETIASATATPAHGLRIWMYTQALRAASVLPVIALGRGKVKEYVRGTSLRLVAGQCYQQRLVVYGGLGHPSRFVAIDQMTTTTLQK